MSPSPSMRSLKQAKETHHNEVCQHGVGQQQVLLSKARPKFIAFHPEWPSIKQAVITRKILGNRDGRSLHQRKEINKESTSKLQADEAFHELLFGNRLCAQGSAIIQYDDQALGVGVQVVEQDNDGKIWVVCNDRRSAKGISTTPLRDATKPDR